MLCKTLAILSAAVAVLASGSRAQDASLIDPRVHVAEGVLEAPRGCSQEGQLETTNRIIVRFSSPMAPQVIDRAIAPLGLRWVQRGEGNAFDVVEAPMGSAVAWATFLNRMPGIEYAEPDFIAEADGTPNDALFFPYQWNLYDIGVKSNGYTSYFGVQAQSAWNYSTGANITVAIVDTGVAYENYGGYFLAPDLVGTTFVSPYDFVNNDAHANDDNSHGTHICGTVRQTTNTNGVGCAGLAYNCRIMPVKVLGRDGKGYDSWVANGIRWAADHGAFVINLSLGSPTPSKTLADAVTYAKARGCFVVAASGNDGHLGISYPAAYCISVGATRFDGKRSGYSNYGPGLSLMAPGGDLSVDQNHDGFGDGIVQQTFNPTTKNPAAFGYYLFQGTSMAAAHVAGLAALVKARHFSWDATYIYLMMTLTARDMGTPGPDAEYGWGLINAYATAKL